LGGGKREPPRKKQGKSFQREASPKKRTREIETEELVGIDVRKGNFRQNRYLTVQREGLFLLGKEGTSGPGGGSRGSPARVGENNIPKKSGGGWGLRGVADPRTKGRGETASEGEKKPADK